MCALCFGADSLTDGHMVSMVPPHSWLPLTWHIGRGPGGDEWRVPNSSQCVYSLAVCCFLVWSLFTIKCWSGPMNQYHSDFCPLLRLPLLRTLSAFHPHFTLHPFFAAPPPPSAPSRCVNQYSLLTHDSPHMSSTAQGLHLGAEAVCVSAFTWVSATLMCLLSYSLSLFLCVNMCVCARACERARVSLKIHQACPGFLQRASAVCSNQPPLYMSEHTNPFVYLSTCCVCVCVCARVWI